MTTRARSDRINAIKRKQKEYFSNAEDIDENTSLSDEFSYENAELSEALDKKYDSGLPIQYLRQDMRRLDLYGCISVTVCALDSLNHLPEESDLRRVFERVNLFSNAGALFLFDVNTEYKHRQILADECFVYELPEAVCVWQNHLHAHAPDWPVTIELYDQSNQLIRTVDYTIRLRAGDAHAKQEGRA